VGLAVRLALSLLAAPAWADEASESEALSPGEVIDLIPFALSKAGVRVYAEETFNVLADFGPADVSELRSTLGLRAAAPLSERLALRVSASTHGSFFVYDGDRSELAADLGGEDLFERLFDASFGLGGAFQLFSHWSLFAEGRAKLSWEDGASLADAVKGSGAFGVGFELEPHLEVALGVDVGTHIDDDRVHVAPVFGFRWRIRDGMRLESQGLGLLFGMDLHPELELQLRGSYESDRYRLDGGGALSEARSLRQREVPLLVAPRWSPTKHWRLTAAAGSVVYQHWRVEADQGEDGGSSVDAGPAALAWLRLEYRF
jgi:hypothetical protein